MKFTRMVQNLPPPDTFRKMFKDMIDLKGEPRALVLTLHLYIEYWLDWLIRKHCKNPDVIENFSLSNKAKILKAFDVLRTDLYDDVLKMNEIRNIFAHDLDIRSEEFRNKFAKKVSELKLKQKINGMPTVVTTSDALSGISFNIITELSELFNQNEK